GGSVRQPAAYCGIVGLKPSYGLVSTRGVVPLSWSLDHVGPMCRTVADAAMLLQPIAGYDALDINSVNAVVPDYRKALRQKVSALRIGIPRAVELPPYQTLPVVGAEAWVFHAPYFTKTPQLYQPGTRQRLQGGSAVSAAAYIEGRRELERLRRAVAGVFSAVDLLVTPTTPV